ncbi:hypothetical protein [Aquimarina latercula]|uniref:hypothetical protein n=1 Tax=Aquimarina latercula TaxID=987 RepID=UPI000481F9F3|nr:hypothetical protein [Aquimarina latercula]
MTFIENELKENREYFINYDKVWQTIESFNKSQDIDNKIKGAHIDTLICTLNLFEEYINRNPPVVDEDFLKRRLCIDAFRIGKLAGYGTSTIKKHFKKLQQLEVLHIRLSMPKYAKGHYYISLNISYIFIAKPLGIILTK